MGPIFQVSDILNTGTEIEHADMTHITQSNNF